MVRRKKTPRDYGDLTLDDLRRDYQIQADVAPLFQSAAPLEPSAWLRETLAKGLRMALVSEKARSEFIVAPILVFLSGALEQPISVYSGVSFNVEPARGLKGVCDFILSKSPPLPTVQAPVLMMVEAKKNDIEEGIGQCAAEMVAADIFNRNAGNDTETVYGCVTTGETWQFLQLTKQSLTIDQNRYFIDNTPKILGIMRQILA